jgi:integrase
MDANLKGFVFPTRRVAGRTPRTSASGMFLPAVERANLRLGEGLALRWRDIRTGPRSISVVRSISGGISEGPTKSRKPRSVPLVGKVERALEDLREQRHHAGNDDIVFAGTIRHLDQSAFTKRFKKALDAARENDPDVPALRVHDLRHTCASLLVAGGIDMRTVQEIMGHASIDTTYRYVHVGPTWQRSLRQFSKGARQSARDCRRAHGKIGTLFRRNDSP